jgi:MFS family permease
MLSLMQNNELVILAGLGLAGLLSALYYQVLGWRWNSRSIDLSLLALLLLAVCGSFVLPSYLPYPPFTWLQWVAENVPKECSAGCTERDLVFVSAALATGLAIFAAIVAVLWGPWWLSPWSRKLRAKAVLEEQASQAEEQRILAGAAPGAKVLYLSRRRRSAVHMLAALEEAFHDDNNSNTSARI